MGRGALCLVFSVVAAIRSDNYELRADMATDVLAMGSDAAEEATLSRYAAEEGTEEDDKGCTAIPEAVMDHVQCLQTEAHNGNEAMRTFADRVYEAMQKCLAQKAPVRAEGELRSLVALELRSLVAFDSLSGGGSYKDWKAVEATMKAEAQEVRDDPELPDADKDLLEQLAILQHLAKMVKDIKKVAAGGRVGVSGTKPNAVSALANLFHVQAPVFTPDTVEAIMKIGRSDAAAMPPDSSL